MATVSAVTSGGLMRTPDGAVSTRRIYVSDKLCMYITNQLYRE